MRIFTVISILLTVAAMIFKWRYRIMNMILTISFLRRMAVTISMNMPAIREKILPNLFQRPN